MLCVKQPQNVFMKFESSFGIIHVEKIEPLNINLVL